ncbi:hypothetical protein B0J17DRAFT_631281 [Rhizoctonia solani]|nr:hypothetical protein B0J17DRAFT_631281 [Rhizoctonia solani]
MPSPLHKALWGMLGVAHGSDSESPQERHQPPDEPPPNPAISVESHTQSSKFDSIIVYTEAVQVDRFEGGPTNPRPYNEPTSAPQTNAFKLPKDLELQCRSIATSGISPSPTHEGRRCMDGCIIAAGTITDCCIRSCFPRGNDKSSRKQYPCCVGVHPKVVTPLIQEL